MMPSYNEMLEAERIKDLLVLFEYLKTHRANMFLPCAFTKDGTFLQISVDLSFMDFQRAFKMPDVWYKYKTVYIEAYINAMTAIMQT